MTPALARSIAGAARAQDRLARMARLNAMSGAELAASLGGGPAMAAPWVEAAAACGMAIAQVQWGRMLLTGTGVPQDRALALRWFVRAARAGDGGARNMVGRCHELGWGTPADAGKAARWYRVAAAAGDAWGIYNLANMHFDGRGVARDRGAAVAGYRRAAAMGHARAMNLLGRCLEEGWGVARQPRSAACWYRRSAEAGYFRGQYNHGVELLSQGHRQAAAAMFVRAGFAADPLLGAPRQRLVQDGYLPDVKHVASTLAGE